MPQNLEDTQYPGTMPRYAVLFSRGKGQPVAAIAPIWDEAQLKYVQARLTSIGFGIQRQPILIHSPADLDRIQGTSSHSIPEPKRLHEPGCIWPTQEHPGDCYVES